MELAASVMIAVFRGLEAFVPVTKATSPSICSVLKSPNHTSVIRLVSHMKNNKETCSLKRTVRANAISLLRLPQFALMKPYEVLMF